MAISRDEVLHVARLARLELTDDEPRPSLPVEEALANAPDREGNFFKVPPA